MKWLINPEPINAIKLAKASARLFTKDGIMQSFMKPLVRSNRRTKQ